MQPEELDTFDRKILTILQQEGRLTNQELADRIALSPSACLRRVRRLEEEGYITGYRAELNQRRLGLGVMAFVKVRLERHNSETDRAFARRIELLPEIVDCHVVSGDGDYMLRVLVRDLDALASFTMEKLLAAPGVREISSTIVLQTLKTCREIPV